MQIDLSKKLLGLLAFSPWILFFIIVPFILPISAKMHTEMGTRELNSVDVGYLVIGSLYVLVVVIYFIMYLNRLKNIDSEKKWFWRKTLILFHVFAIPIFWYKYIWKEYK